ncbi:MAG: DUF4168 domain-containing protein [Desulfohalobiaceae bacterium]
MSRLKELILASVLVVSLILCSASVGWAEDEKNDVFESETDKNTELEAEDITDKDLRAFVKASEEVQDIRWEYTKKMHEGEGDEEELREEALEEMRDAIQDQGLDEETYRGIAYHVHEDDELLEDFY